MVEHLVIWSSALAHETEEWRRGYQKDVRVKFYFRRKSSLRTISQRMSLSLYPSFSVLESIRSIIAASLKPILLAKA